MVKVLKYICENTQFYMGENTHIYFITCIKSG